MSQVHHDHAAVHAIARVLGIVVASVLPPLSTFVLYYVHPAVARLCIVLGFSIVFSFALAVFSRATVAEIFVGTAA